ncbi:hypothetical protein [Corynebacterium epidermidicanis]|uniref:Uncharacterized protein n=1 Tax=Corynebacterium epidermidicanis TaxID=1050174 RepID=A0A0G3GMJ5_9CORY|nr:hypothetical protein [Corynebacterium epidermidicanis]AKK02364.1 hypothetical protein CEPID_02415 [Corynebacterium epidermidicanis]
MTIGYLVNPDLTSRKIEFELEHAAQFLGRVDNERVSVAFQEDGKTLAALYSSDAKSEGAEPNPVASMAKNEAATGNSAFFTDPTSAICGPVIFVGAEGADITDADIERVEDGIRAARNYKEDEPEDYSLWRGAVLNLNR